MKNLLRGIRAWWMRRFRGFVAAPSTGGGRGTSWQEHKCHEIGFTCRCGQVLAFMSRDLVIRAHDHNAQCTALRDFAFRHSVAPPATCGCPIADARYIKICPTCHLGHWKDASPKLSQVAARSRA